MAEPTVDSMPATPAPPPLPKKRSWRWFKITVGILFGLILLVKILVSFSSLDLELTRKDAWRHDDGKGLEIVNVGRSPITITDIVINERSDCALATGPDGKLRFTLGVGDKRLLGSQCQIIRAHIQSDQGTSTYSFNR